MNELLERVVEGLAKVQRCFRDELRDEKVPVLVDLYARESLGLAREEAQGRDAGQIGQRLAPPPCSGQTLEQIGPIERLPGPPGEKTQGNRAVRIVERAAQE